MKLSDSYNKVFPDAVRGRYDFAEVRKASGVLFGTNPEALSDIIDVLANFHVSLTDLTDPGGSKGAVARHLDEAFRVKGWREAGHTTSTTLTLQIYPYKEAGETTTQEHISTYGSSGHKVDNVRGRVALDVEWNAKDGNLDRDLSNFRALHDADMIDAGVIITRRQDSTKYAANALAEMAGVVRHDDKGKRIILLGTTTTTNLEKLLFRLERGDSGPCPVLAIGITDRCYLPGPDDPGLEPFGGPLAPQPPADGNE